MFVPYFYHDRKQLPHQYHFKKWLGFSGDGNELMPIFLRISFVKNYFKENFKIFIFLNQKQRKNLFSFCSAMEMDKFENSLF